MTKWLRRPTATTRAIRHMSQEQVDKFAEDLTRVLKDTALDNGERAARIQEIERQILREGGKE